MFNNILISTNTYSKQDQKKLKGLDYVKTHIYEICVNFLLNEFGSNTFTSHITILECVRRENNNMTIFLPHITVTNTIDNTQLHFGICPTKRSAGQNRDLLKIPLFEFWGSVHYPPILSKDIQEKIKKAFYQILNKNGWIFVWNSSNSSESEPQSL